ncbi:MAG: hypothetical protein HYS17_09010 [Micavibrio aeruginosavorus]|uniref:Uncharacterized protein n=1 Tax=Micavibrio aeruginosavorus TaxID=349221 RepID=A0A7T5R1B6_9BACT|nr:MAG: hypothetical protein HYS17_09010 [Micavibrio aeruginosavorus]
MTTIRHPGIDMIENIRSRGDLTDEQILSRMHTEKAALNLAMHKTSPALLKSEDISMLRKYEVGIAYIRIVDPENPARINALREAIKGNNPTGQPNDSLLYERRKEYALKDNRPGERLSIIFD